MAQNNVNNKMSTMKYDHRLFIQVSGQLNPRHIENAQPFFYCSMFMSPKFMNIPTCTSPNTGEEFLQHSPCWLA